MKPGINPKIDYAFKKLFGSEANRDILIALLNAVLCFPLGKRIVEVELMNPFNEKDTFGGKLSIVDIKARDESGRLFVIEMQLVLQPEFRKRLLFYWSKLFQQQLPKGKKFLELKPAYAIAFVGDVLFPEVSAYHTRFQLWDVENGIAFSDDMEVHIIELAKFKVSVEELREPLEQSCYFLQHAAELDDQELPVNLDQPPIRRAMEVLAMVSEAERERILQIEREIRAIDRRTFDELLEETEAKRIKTGRIHLCQRLLKQAPTSKADLLQMSLADLERLAEELERQLPFN